MGLGVWNEKQWGRQGSMRLWRNLLWGRGRGPAFQERTCVFCASFDGTGPRPKSAWLAARSRACQSWAQCGPLRFFEVRQQKTKLPFLIRAVVKVESAIGAAAQAVRPRISRVPRAPWLLSRAPSIRPRSTAGLAAFWVRIQRASGFNAWPFELQALSRGAQIGCVYIASVASGGGSGGDAILTIWSLLAASVLLGGPS